MKTYFLIAMIVMQNFFLQAQLPTKEVYAESFEQSRNEIVKFLRHKTGILDSSVFIVAITHHFKYPIDFAAENFNDGIYKIGTGGSHSSIYLMTVQNHVLNIYESSDFLSFLQASIFVIKKLKINGVDSQRNVFQSLLNGW